jgi:hypothetical protein
MPMKAGYDLLLISGGFSAHLMRTPAIRVSLKALWWRTG